MKKKMTLILLATLFVVAGSFAQTQRVLSQKHLPTIAQQLGKNEQQQPSMKSLQMLNSVEKQKGLRASVAAHNMLTGKKAVRKHSTSRRAAADIIYDQPEGTKKTYSRSGSAYYYSLFGIGQADFDGAVGAVVFGENNKVYIKDIVSQAGLGTWIEGTISGSTITIQLPQTVTYYPEDGYCLEVSRLTYNDGWYYKSDNQTIKLAYNAANGTIATTGKLNTAEDIIGLTYDDDGSWCGFGDWNITMTTVADPLVEAPAGLTTEQYSLSGEGYDGSLVNVGFDGNDVYVQGIDRNLPDNWVKGTISGNKVTFKNGQYVGVDEVANYHIYMMSAKVEKEWDDWYEEYIDTYVFDTSDIEFTYDAATKTLSESTPFLLNAGKSAVNYLYSFNNAKLTKFVEVAATPAPAEVNLSEAGWDDYLYGYGWGTVEFEIPCADTEGNFILPEKLSYQLYTKVNGVVEPLTLSWYDYKEQQEPTMTEIPYGYSDDWDITTNYIYYYIIGPEAFGIQTIYRGGGEEHRSEIAWAEAFGMGAEIQPAAATPAYPDVTLAENDNRIDYGFYTGDGDIKTVTNNYKPETYDVAIKLADPTMVGTVIESITFPLQEVEGVSDINVFLTSQLRVENGKNAADLAVKAVTPAEPGFITVKLDKPYLIPEGGVYVGYSLTINDASSEANSMPIAVMPGVNEGGFYLHTSDGFLKWFDVSEGFNGSSIIQVKLAGSSIKANAASMAKGETVYVMTGQDFKVPVTVTNHGAKGIQSVDITYSLAGKTDTQHINTTVDAFYGKSATVNMTIPAIADKGNYELALKVDKVNDAVNEDTTASATIPVVALNTIPQKRTLLEEYTGTWCGYCPRGYVGLEKLAELYPDDYVLVSYHNDDDMEIMNADAFPSTVEGYPDAWMDRAVEVDAYYGINYGKKDLGIVDDLAERNKMFGQADINVSATKADGESMVNVAAEVTFPYDMTNNKFIVEYILTADGLSNPTWGQSNYYADGSYGYPMYMDTFTRGASTVYGLVFNDVAVMTSEQWGGSGRSNIITAATADTPIKLQYSFNLDYAVNTAGQPVIQDVNKVNIIALLIDAATGNVVNANKVKLSESTGIVTVKAHQDANAAIYNLNGQKVQTVRKGLYIQNGRKVVVR